MIGLGRYVASRVRADPEVTTLAKLVSEPQAMLLRRVSERNAAIDALTDREAERDLAVDRFNAGMMDLGRRAYAFYGSRTDQEYLRIFPKAPSTLAATPDSHRLSVFGAVLREAQSSHGPREFAPTVKKLSEAFKHLEAAEKLVSAALKDVDRARALEQSARGDWFAGYRRLFAQLTDRFPRDKARVDHYFRSAPTPKRKAPSPQSTSAALMPNAA